MRHLAVPEVPLVINLLSMRTAKRSVRAAPSKSSKSGAVSYTSRRRPNKMGVLRIIKRLTVSFTPLLADKDGGCCMLHVVLIIPK
jgi:hypothetical protein